jgi:Ca2+-binding EF-hand superfamily protein
MINVLVEFAFKLFDQDGDGLLRLNDMKAMMKEIYGIKSATDPKLIR